MLYRVPMWSRALHVTVGRYPTGTWHVALVETEYRRGIPRDTNVLVDVVGDEADVQRNVAAAVRTLMRRVIEDRYEEAVAAAVEPSRGVRANLRPAERPPQEPSRSASQ